MASAARPGYTGTAKFLHWSIVSLLIVQFVIAWTMPGIHRDTPVTTLISLHYSIGMLILGVVLLRLIWRLIHGEPPPEDGVPRWQTASARAVHWALYLLLFAVPMAGWVNASWRGMPVTFFGLATMPALVAKHAAGWRWTGRTHILMANYALLALVGLHVAAGLYHYFVRRDRVLQRMLPARRMGA